MARKKKKSGKRSKSRRRVGGVHPGIMNFGLTAVGVAAGAGIATYMVQGIKSASPTMPAYLGGAAVGIAGVAATMFVKPSPLVTGLALGAAGVGFAMALNETVVSLPGISGVDMGLTNARPNQGGFLSKTVGYAGYKGIPKNRIGTFSGASNMAAAVGALYSN